MRRALFTILAATALVGPLGGIAAAAPSTDATSVQPITVNGSYQPLVGDFDCTAGNAAEDIVWYGAGSAPDAVWWRDGWNQTPTVTKATLSVSGTYTPFTGDFDGDDCSDIFWYAPGPAPDSIWYGTKGRSWDKRPVTVNGTYLPVPGSFTPDQADDVFWYGPGAAPDRATLGSATRGTMPSVAAPQVNGTYRPAAMTTHLSKVNGDDSIFWYGPGAAPDSMWTEVDLSNHTHGTAAAPLGGDYRPVEEQGYTVFYSEHAGDDPVYRATPSGLDDLQPASAADISGSYRVNPTNHRGLVVWHQPGPGQDYLWG